MSTTTSASQVGRSPNYLIRCKSNAMRSWRPGVPISAVEIDPRVVDVTVTDARLDVRLRDGRTITAPLSWFPRLAAAEPAARNVWEPSAAGLGIHWPEIDEDLSVEGLLRSRNTN